jgi:hypothetical protein
LARNVSRKYPLFAGPSATVRRPLQLAPDALPDRLRKHQAIDLHRADELARTSVFAGKVHG